MGQRRRWEHHRASAVSVRAREIKNLQTCAGKEQDRRSFFQWKRVSWWCRNIHSFYGGVMGNVIVGATMSLDGFMNDRHGDVIRLYPDLEALRRTAMLQEALRLTAMGGIGHRSDRLPQLAAPGSQ